MLVSGSVYNVYMNVYIIGWFQFISTGFFKSWPRQRTHFCDLLGNQSRSLWKSWQWIFSCMLFGNQNASFNCFQFKQLDAECNWFWIWLTVVTLWQTNISMANPDYSIENTTSSLMVHVPLLLDLQDLPLGFLFTQTFQALKVEALAYVREKTYPSNNFIRYLHFLYPPVNKHSWLENPHLE